MSQEIKPDSVYTTEEAQDFLRISNRTIKRYLKSGIIRANKVGGRYRILGRELLKLVSPETEEKAVKAYQKIKQKTKKKRVTYNGPGKQAFNKAEVEDVFNDLGLGDE